MNTKLSLLSQQDKLHPALGPEQGMAGLSAPKLKSKGSLKEKRSSIQ